MAETYEFTFDVNVTKTVPISGSKDEDAAIGALYELLEKKGIDKNLIKDLSWRVVPAPQKKDN